MQLTPELIRINKRRHEANRIRIEAQSHWTQKDFEDLLFGYWELPDTAQSLDEAVVNIESIEKLAFDPRTPQAGAEKLQSLLKAAKQQGAFDMKEGESMTVRIP